MYSYRHRYASSQWSKSATNLTTVMTRTSLSIRVHTTLNRNRFVFLPQYQRNEINLCLDNRNTDSDLKGHALHYANELLVRVRQTIANSLNMQKQFEIVVWEKSKDTYSLSVRVQTTISHISICFLPQYQRQRKCCFFRARGGKGIA